jgi:hypothetical protein
MTVITKPGVYDAIPAEIYHGQLTPTPSISRSMAHEMVTTCPLKAWHGSYLNPEREPENKKAFDLGHAGHLIVLEPELWAEKVVEIVADDYRTKAAQQARDEAYLAGKIPLLPHHKAQIVGMHKVLMGHPLAKSAFTNGRAEQTIVARDPETGLWLKARPDYLRAVGGTAMMLDYKTTGNANPLEFAKRVWDMGYYMQDPWYRLVYELATGEPVDGFLYVVQETDAPYCVSVNRLGKQDVEWGMLQSRRAVHIFAECIATGQWPDYGDAIADISMPSWAHYQLADMAGAGRLDPPKPSIAMLEQAKQLQAPAQEAAQ